MQVFTCQISRKSDQNCGRDSATVFPTNMAAVTSSIMLMSWNSNAHNYTYTGPFLESFTKIGAVVLAFSRKQTDTLTHTDTQTHRQTTPVFPDPNDYNTFSQWKWLNVKRTNTLHSVNQVFSHNVSAAHWLPLSSEKEQNTKNE